ncbi:ORC-CDC6 family AAA ATPase [Xanthobacter versatilis]|uniref:ORC-CDC6 family AAA ATPase n=1 Tax=Xanthobacter autotrophicus (strain ATCC BAA-1158 / Py2) TaxID=78245 RepID=UPI00372CCA32
MDAKEANTCFMRFEDRAERITSKQVAETFVAVGPILNILSSNNNQIMYGRRGTGKTHALRYFQSQKRDAGDIAIYIDAQNIGSNGSLYNDPTLPISERATRLLVDICSELHSALTDEFTDPDKEWDLSEAIPLLSKFNDSYLETRVAGTVETETSQKDSESQKSGISAGLKLAKDPSLDLGGSQEASSAKETAGRRKESGVEESWLDFSFFSRTLNELASFVAPKRIWVLLDEWTTIPSDLQPYLADLLRRSMFSVKNITVKIAAIEHRAVFKKDMENNSYIGMELSADISVAINLDDFLVIERDESRAKEFFRHFVKNHVASVAPELGIKSSIDNVVQVAFTQDNVFLEFVRASEGVPRDAMHILSQAAQKAFESAIAMGHIRAAAHQFFQSEKQITIQANQESRLLLDWIRDVVIGERRTRNFLLPVGTNDPIIDRLFDRRALHILSRSRSAAHRPGERFEVYKIDYGLYVDLINTDKAPTEIDFDTSFEVPFDDARSYRRAILDLSEFYAKHPELKQGGT